MLLSSSRNGRKNTFKISVFAGTRKKLLQREDRLTGWAIPHLPHLTQQALGSQHPLCRRAPRSPTRLPGSASWPTAPGPTAAHRHRPLSLNWPPPPVPTQNPLPPMAHSNKGSTPASLHSTSAQWDLSAQPTPRLTGTFHTGPHPPVPSAHQQCGPHVGTTSLRVAQAHSSPHTLQSKQPIPTSKHGLHTKNSLLYSVE